MIVLLRDDQPPMALDDMKDQSQAQQCTLLSLPAELRNQIWRYILLQDTKSKHSLPLYTSQEVSKSSRDQTRFCANVLRTCKQICGEGTPILYGENIFSAHRSLLASLPSFMLLTYPSKKQLPPVIYPRVQKLIRRYHILVRLDTDPQFSKRQVEESFNGVEELHIDVFQSMYASCDFSVLSLFEGVRGVEKVTIDGSLGDGKYAEWLARTMELPLGTPATPYWEKYVGGVPAWDAWTNGNR